MPKERSPGQTAVSVSLSREALAKIDARADELGLSRSAYLKLMATGEGPLKTLPNSPAQPPQTPAQSAPADPSAPGPAASETVKPLDFTKEVYAFLLIAIPAMQEYEALKDKGDTNPGDPQTIEIPPDLAETPLWRFFLHERDEILRLKWIESQKARGDIGLSKAIQIWLQLHRALWIAGLTPEP